MRHKGQVRRGRLYHTLRLQIGRRKTARVPPRKENALANHAVMRRRVDPQFATRRTVSPTSILARNAVRIRKIGRRANGPREVRPHSSFFISPHVKRTPDGARNADIRCGLGPNEPDVFSRTALRRPLTGCILPRTELRPATEPGTRSVPSGRHGQTDTYGRGPGALAALSPKRSRRARPEGRDRRRRTDGRAVSRTQFSPRREARPAVAGGPTRMPDDGVRPIQHRENNTPHIRRSALER